MNRQYSSERAVKVYNFGCSANRAIAEGLMGALKADGYVITEKAEDTQVVVVNTCVVKQNTEHKIKDLLLNLKGVPNLVITGCLPVVMREWITENLPHALILFPEMAGHIVEILNNHPVPEIKNAPANNWAQLYHSPRERYNPVITTIEVARGCLSNCAYCIVKHTKGKLRSRNPKSIVSEVQSALGVGSREIWLTAQDLGVYGWDLSPKVYLPQLVSQILHIEGDFFVRLGMMTPITVNKFKSDLITIMKDPKMFRFLHLPIQSGSDPILRKMRRKESISEFIELINQLTSKIEELVLATDVIIGFPGESEADYEATKFLLKTIRPTIVNLSKYTDRPGTKAARMTNKIPSQIKSQRSRKLTQIVKGITEQNLKKWVGWKGKVIIDEKGKEPHQFQGRNSSYLPVILEESNGKIGQFVEVQITAAGKSFLIGEIIK